MYLLCLSLLYVHLLYVALTSCILARFVHNTMLACLVDWLAGVNRSIEMHRLCQGLIYLISLIRQGQLPGGASLPEDPKLTTSPSQKARPESPSCRLLPPAACCPSCTHWSSPSQVHPPPLIPALLCLLLWLQAPCPTGLQLRRVVTYL